MNMSGEGDVGSSRVLLFCCVSLGLLATTISLLMVVLPDWSTGGLSVGQIVMCGFGVLAVLGAHFLLTLCRVVSIALRFLVVILWLFCMSYVLYGQAGFFLSLQEQAGIRRAAAIDKPLLELQPHRKLTEILSDQVPIRTELEAKSQIQCDNGCFTLKVRLASLNAKLNVLIAEENEVKRRDALQDRHDELVDSARDDPVTFRVATLLNLTVAQFGLVMNFVFSCILEGIACLCWYIVVGNRYSRLALRTKDCHLNQTVATTNSDCTDLKSEIELNNKVVTLVKEVREGNLKLTVNEVRKYFSCAQATAANLKRMAEERLAT